MSLDINKILSDVNAVIEKARSLNAEALKLGRELNEIDERNHFERNIVFQSLIEFRDKLQLILRNTVEKNVSEERGYERYSARELAALRREAEKRALEEVIEINREFLYQSYNPIISSSLEADDKKRLEEYYVKREFFGIWKIKDLFEKIENELRRIERLDDEKKQIIEKIDALNRKRDELLNMLKMLREEIKKALEGT